MQQVPYTYIVHVTCDLTTFTYSELKHMQWKQHMAYQVWSTGMAKQKVLFVGFVVLIKYFKVKISQFFAIFDIVIVLSTCQDAEMSTSGNFCVDDDDN